MKKWIWMVLLLAIILSGCRQAAPEQTVVPSEPEIVTAATVSEIPAEVQTEITLPPEDPHSRFYIPGVAVEDVILYFNEVCLDAEMINSGNPRVLQKWTAPIYYILNGDPTAEDLAVLSNFCSWLNTLEGFPGIFPAEEELQTNLRIHFCSESDMLSIMGDGFFGLDGAVTF